jgi:DNA repair protein RadC
MASLSDGELFELLLGGTARDRPARELSNRLLAHLGGLGALSSASLEAFAEVDGVGRVKATRIAAAVEVGRRSLVGELEKEPVVIDTANCVADWARPRIGGLHHEEVWVLCLDGRNRLRVARRVAQGGVHGCALTVKDVFRPAMSNSASAIVLVHNHPSGSAEPSQEDLTMTRDLALAADVLGIALLDHVIVTRRNSSSLSELGVIP